MIKRYLKSLVCVNHSSNSWSNCKLDTSNIVWSLKNDASAIITAKIARYEDLGLKSATLYRITSGQTCAIHRPAQITHDKQWTPWAHFLVAVKPWANATDVMPSCGNGWVLSLQRGKSTASPALKHRGNERRVSAERKEYGVRLVFSSRSVRHISMLLASILHQM